MMKNFLKISMAIVATAFLCACSDDDDEVKKLITFHTGSSQANALSSNRTMEVMPVSGTSVMTDTNQFLYNGDLQKVYLADVTLADGSPLRGFYFFCNPRGAKRLFQATASNMGGFIVVKYDGVSIGLRKVDMAINDGKIFFTPEIPLDDDIEVLVENMNKAIDTINKIKESEDSW